MSPSADRGVQGSSTLARCLSGIDARWPFIKLLSLSFYSAWILLTMTGNSTLSYADPANAAQSGAVLYLLSGVALSACLIAAGALKDKAAKLVSSGPFLIAMGLLAGLCTFVLSGGISLLPYDILFPLCSVGTGLSTAFICLRIGCVFSDMPHGNPFFTVFGAGLVSNLICFLCLGVPAELSRLLIAVLPLAAALSTQLDIRSVQDRSHLLEDRIPQNDLPRWYFPRLIAAILLMCVAVGCIKGLAGLAESGGDPAWWNSVMIFSTLAVTMAMMTAFAIAFSLHNFEIGSVYLPIIVCTAAVIVVCCIIGELMGPLQKMLVDVSYNIFILAIWCVLQDLGSRTQIGAVRVFGFGRGASGLGTTLGWLAAFAINQAGYAGASLPLVFVGAALMVFAATGLVSNISTVSKALQRKLVAEVPAPAPAASSSAQQGAGAHDAIHCACREIAAQAGLTEREAEAMELLGRGRTVGFVAEELGISYNTVKGYAKNVYSKCGVHSRQELIDAIERRLG
ncbi:MAG: response regulator transcription factor [Coriobacteriales bacterium]